MHLYEERKYIQDLVRPLHKRPNTAFVRKEYPIFISKFGKTFPNQAAFHNCCAREWMKIKGLDYKNPTGKEVVHQKNPYKGTPRKINKVFSRSTYILYVNGSIFGFDTKDEMEEFLTNNQVIGMVKAFIDIPIKISTSVKIGKPSWSDK